MSRIGRKPINIPAGVDVKVSDGVVTVSYTHLDVYKRQCMKWL